MLLRWKKRRKEQENAEKSAFRRAGFTLVETLVSVTLLMILMAMVVGIVSPAFKVFIRMQKLQFAQMILDNVVEDVQDTVREATTYVKIYASDDSAGSATENIADAYGIGSTYVSATSGPVLEYLNTDGYVVLVSTGGCADTYLYRNTTIDSMFDTVDPGQLLFRYYRRVDQSSSGTDYKYYYYTRKDDTTNYPVARAATTAFGSGYYMGNYLKITFSFPEGTTNGGPVTYLKATASLYDDQGMNEDDLVVTEEFYIDFRYQVNRYSDLTATYDTTSDMQWSVTPTTN